MKTSINDNSDVYYKGLYWNDVTKVYKYICKNFKGDEKMGEKNSKMEYMKPPFCSVIVLNYNGEKFLKKTLESVLALDYSKSDYEIIVVDNASKDKSAEIIHELARPNGPLLTYEVKNGPSISSILLQKNIGFAGGNNIGIKQANGKYVTLLNNDCTVDKNWLKELVGVAEKDEKIFAVNSKIYLGNTNKIQNAGIRIFANGYAQDIGAIPNNKIQDYEEDRGQYDKEREVDAACGAAVLYRKSILDKIGLLDGSFFLYYEDVEISERAKNKVTRLYIHPRPQSTTSTPPRVTNGPLFYLS